MHLDSKREKAVLNLWSPRPVNMIYEPHQKLMFEKLQNFEALQLKSDCSRQP